MKITDNIAALKMSQGMDPHGVLQRLSRKKYPDFFLLLEGAKFYNADIKRMAASYFDLHKQTKIAFWPIFLLFFYPSSLLIGVGFVAMITVDFVYPVIAELYAHSGVALPFATNIVLSIGITGIGIIIFTLIFAVFITAFLPLTILSRKTFGSKITAISRLNYITPVSFSKKLMTLRWLVLTKHLVAAGIPFQTASAWLSNKRSLNGIIDPQYLELLSEVTEVSQDEQTLATLALDMKLDIDNIIQRTERIYIPLLLVVIGVFVGIFLVGTYLPIFGMGGLID